VFVIERRIGRKKFLFFEEVEKEEKKKIETLYDVVFSTDNIYYIGTVLLKEKEEKERTMYKRVISFRIAFSFFFCQVSD
jgi:hypothetical protein